MAIKGVGIHKFKARLIKDILLQLKKDRGDFDLNHLLAVDMAVARAELQKYKGIGAKSINCILLFSLGLPAFPVDTWIIKALPQLYFPRRAPKPTRLQAFIKNPFAPHHGYAQQYLFHHVRTQGGLLGETSEE